LWLSASYPVVFRFKYQPGDQLSWLWHFVIGGATPDVVLSALCHMLSWGKFWENFSRRDDRQRQLRIACYVQSYIYNIRKFSASLR
jgi:hypothetical protein